MGETGTVVNDINMAFPNIRIVPREGKVAIPFIFIKYVFYDAEEHSNMVCLVKNV